MNNFQNSTCKHSETAQSAVNQHPWPCQKMRSDMVLHSKGLSSFLNLNVYYVIYRMCPGQHEIQSAWNPVRRQYAFSPRFQGSPNPSGHTSYICRSVDNLLCDVCSGLVKTKSICTTKNDRSHFNNIFQHCRVSRITNKNYSTASKNYNIANAGFSPTEIKLKCLYVTWKTQT